MSPKFSFILLSLFLTLVTACSGNSSSKSSSVPATLNIVVGLVQSGQADNVDVQGVAVTVNGQLTLDETTGALSGVQTRTDSRGRFAIGLDYDDPSSIILFARGSAVSATDNVTSIQCKLPQGCAIRQNSGELINVAFTEYYPSEYYYDYIVNEKADDKPETDDAFTSVDSTLWSAALEIAAEGQFISINSITDMSGAFGFSTYINDGTGVCNAQECEANKQASGYFSKYGIMKANTQVSNLIGIPDIISIEPANVASLDSISATSSSNLQASIRYGALIAALQQIQLSYDNALASRAERRFRRVLNSQFSQNRGQLFQKDSPIEQVLTKELWYTTAKEILIAANTHFVNLNKVLPVEVGSVISLFELELQSLEAGKLTQAVPSISQDLADSYNNEIDFTKAMLTHLVSAAKEFSTPEYREKADSYQKQLIEIGDEVSPAFNVITSSLLDVYGYYLSCTHTSCDPLNPWHQFNTDFDSSTNNLTLTFSDTEGDELVVSQRIVDLITNDANDSPTESLAIDVVFTGVLKNDKLTVLTDFSEEKLGDASLRISYNEIVNQVMPDAALAENNPSMPVNGRIYPVAYEFSFTSLEMKYQPDDAAKELTLQGAFSWLLRGVKDVRDANSPTRYNLNNLTVVMNVSGAELGRLSDEALTDDVVMSLTGSGFNTSNYYPDSTFPEWDNYFVPAEGHRFGESSGIEILETSIVDYTFPQINPDGTSVSGAIVDGVVVPDKSVQVKVLRFDYLHSGSAAFVVYPAGADNTYLGLLCSITPANEEYFEKGQISNVGADNSSGTDPLSVFDCVSQDFYEGAATVNDFINQLWDIDSQVKDFIRAINVVGEGVYFADLITSGQLALIEAGSAPDDLPVFSSGITSFTGTMQAPAMLGIDNIRLQLRPMLVNSAGTAKLAEVAVDLNLIRPTPSSINVGLFIAYNPDQILNTDDGLPVVAAGADVESYYVAFKTDANGNEIGEFIFNWYGAQLVDGGDGSKYLQDYDASNPAPKEDFLFNLGTDITYGNVDTSAGYTRCGFVFSGKDSDQECSAVAYLTFRGLVTGTIREERKGVYVARFIDESWMVLGN
jgi:hypothetical protein